ncbi:MAG TPA: transcription termination/antitermination NusG family protein [Ferruginibacter sp.]|nr:transcription termination/antitermination NusG family protein [Ferruginibacter sp.]HPH92053.1 transcription termination/antitermination NusG family protein [Ferruginibacter sp.]
MTTQWYAVCTRPQQELKVSAALTKKGIENLCPLTRKMLVSNGFRKKLTWNPVFPSFVFVHITEAQFNTVLRTNDVMSFMYWMGKPAVVNDADIKTIEQFTTRYPNVTVQKTAIIKNAVLAAAAFDETAEEEVELQDERIRTVVPSLGFILTASREKNYRVINTNIERGKMID